MPHHNDLMEAQPFKPAASAASVALINNIATELVEHIILQLSPLQILDSKHVNKKFNDTIQGSVSIQNRINFLDISPPSPAKTGALRVVLNPAIFTQSLEVEQHQTTHELTKLSWFDYTVVIECNHIGAIVHDRVVRDDSVYLSMALFTALPARLEIKFPIICDTATTVFSFFFEAGSIVTFKDVLILVDRLRELAEAHSKLRMKWTKTINFLFPEDTEVRTNGVPMLCDDEYAFKWKQFDVEDDNEDDDNDEQDFFGNLFDG